MIFGVYILTIGMWNTNELHTFLLNVNISLETLLSIDCVDCIYGIDSVNCIDMFDCIDISY